MRQVLKGNCICALQTWRVLLTRRGEESESGMCLLICPVKDKLIILTCVRMRLGSYCCVFIFGHRFSHALTANTHTHALKKQNLNT